MLIWFSFLCTDRLLCFLTLLEMLTLFSCMCIMASDTFTEIESAASSMLKGPSSFSETWYRASEKHRDGRVIKFALTLVLTFR